MALFKFNAFLLIFYGYQYCLATTVVKFRMLFVCIWHLWLSILRNVNITSKSANKIKKSIHLTNFFANTMFRNRIQDDDHIHVWALIGLLAAAAFLMLAGISVFIMASASKLGKNGLMVRSQIVNFCFIRFWWRKCIWLEPFPANNSTY